MGNEHILAIDDEEDILELVRYTLTKEGYRVSTALSGEDGLSMFELGPHDLVLLDLMLPGMNGLDVCKAMRQHEQNAQTPIIMLTAKGEESDIVNGLELGADDYITKPFSNRVLVARVKTAFRRKQSESGENESIKINDLEINPGKHEVLLGGEPLALTLTEYRLLHFLARRPGWVFTRYQIVDAVRGGGFQVTDRSVDVQVVGLRKKLGDAGRYIETVRGVGYRFRD